MSKPGMKGLRYLNRFSRERHTASKKLELTGRNHSNGWVGLPMNGRRIQAIWAPTRPKTMIQMRKMVLTLSEAGLGTGRRITRGGGGAPSAGVTTGGTVTLSGTEVARGVAWAGGSSAAVSRSSVRRRNAHPRKPLM